MLRRGLVAGALAVGAIVLPAGAAVADEDCTTTYVVQVVDASPFLVTGPSPNPIVERDPQTGSITVHPQNVVPAVVGLGDGVVGFAGALPGLTTAYVDCVV